MDDVLVTPQMQEQPTGACKGDIRWDGANSRWWTCVECGHRSYLQHTYHQPAAPQPVKAKKLSPYERLRNWLW